MESKLEILSDSGPSISETAAYCSCSELDQDDPPVNQSSQLTTHLHQSFRYYALIMFLAEWLRCPAAYKAQKGTNPRSAFVNAGCLV